MQMFNAEHIFGAIISGINGFWPSGGNMGVFTLKSLLASNNKSNPLHNFFLMIAGFTVFFWYLFCLYNCLDFNSVLYLSSIVGTS